MPLATEHFVLQAARSAIVGEQVGRGSIYLGAVSSTLIAFGFLAQVVTRLDPFVAAVLPRCSCWVSSPSPPCCATPWRTWCCCGRYSASAATTAVWSRGRRVL